MNEKMGIPNRKHTRGQQKEVVTPGQNVKRYRAGALDVRTGLVTWVEGESKASVWFIVLLQQLLRFYPKVRVIHGVLDNYRIHDSKITQAVWFLSMKQRTMEGLWEFLGQVLDAFAPAECRNYFRHCG